MSQTPVFDDGLARRLPLPLAKLYRQAHNVKSALDRHQAAYFLWEAALKLLGSVAVVTYAERSNPDPKLAERLQNLARPALGHWWEFVRLLVPALADMGDDGFGTVRGLLLGRARDDLPRAAGLDAALRAVLEDGAGARVTVRLSELFDRLVRYRNKVIGHGAPGRHPTSFYQQMGSALLAGVPELLGRLDVLAGRKLVYVADVSRQAAGDWLVERYDLAGEAAGRLEPLRLPEAATTRLPRPERIYLSDFVALGLSQEAAAGPVALDAERRSLRPLHPLAVYDPETDDVLFLNSRHGRHGAEYLCYTSGRVVVRPDAGTEQRDLLARVLHLAVDDAEVEQWAARSQDEEGPAPVAELPGSRTVGEFELLGKLGQGGMGVVYRAWQPSVGRQVALKCLLRAGDERAEARFAREIRALGRVEHPQVVRIFTSGAEGDQWFYAMELLEGATLGAVCEQLQGRVPGAAAVDLKTWHDSVSTACEEARKAEKPLAAAPQPARSPAAAPSLPAPTGRGYVEQVVELIRQVAEATHALHEAGVIHRDIKPGNIMVNQDGTEAVLMDLGLAQLADQMEGRLTRTRQFVGTLRYASPEQVLAVDRLDRRSDVYSLGATLWELLTLRPMYGATDQTPTAELMKRIQYGKPEPVRQLNGRVPRDLETIAQKCLAKDPAERYQTAGELSDELQRFLAGQPIQARRLGPPEQLWRWLKQNARLAGVGVVLLLLLAVIGILWFGGGGHQDATTTPEPNAMQGRLLPVYRCLVYSPREARVIRFEVQPGQTVRTGERLVSLYSDRLREEVVRLKSEIDQEDNLIKELNARLSPDNANARAELLRDLRQHQAARDAKFQERQALLQMTEAEPERPGYFWRTCPGFAAAAPERPIPQWRVFGGDFRERLTDRTVQSNEPLLGLGAPDGPWEIELRLSGKRLGLVLRALKEANGKALDVEFWLPGDSRHAYRAKLYRERLGGEAVPRPEAGAENGVVASIDVQGPDIPREGLVPADLLVAGLEVAVRIPAAEEAELVQEIQPPGPDARRIVQTGLIELGPNATDLVLVPFDGCVLKRIAVREGEAVEQGQLLAELDSLDLRVRRLQAGLQIATCDHQLQDLRKRVAATADPGDRTRLEGELAIAQAELDRATREQQVLEKAMTSLQLRSPRPGVVLGTPRAEEFGKALEKGQVFCKVVDPGRLRVLIPIAPATSRRLKEALKGGPPPPALRAVIRPEGLGAYTWEGKVMRTSLAEIPAREIPTVLTTKGGGPVPVVPGTQPGVYAPREEQYLIAIEFLNADGVLRPGSRAEVTIMIP